MKHVHLLDCPIRSYAWGSRTFLAELQGRAAPAPEPEAELWAGAHPAAPSQVEVDGESVPLDAWIARDPAGVLGRRVARRFGARLPFLLKILAAERPLSLQVHPDAARAREGHAREQRAGLDPRAPERCYPDPHAKPELVCALTPFEALAGFRPSGRIRAVLEVLGSGAGGEDLRPAVAALGVNPGPGGTRQALETLLAIPPGRRRAVVARGVQVADRLAPEDPGAAWVARLAGAWPEDPAALAPLLLEHVALAPGQALFLAPGTLHCHLRGAAVEVQASSDNVVRAGLTAKPVAVREVLRIARFEPGGTTLPAPRVVAGGERVYPTRADEFRLSEIRLEREWSPRPSDGVELLLCTEGELAVAASAADEEVVLTPGRAALVPAAARGFRLRGEGAVFRVVVPESVG